MIGGIIMVGGAIATLAALGWPWHNSGIEPWLGTPAAFAFPGIALILAAARSAIRNAGIMTIVPLWIAWAGVGLVIAASGWALMFDATAGITAGRASHPLLAALGTVAVVVVGLCRTYWPTKATAVVDRIGAGLR